MKEGGTFVFYMQLVGCGLAAGHDRCGRYRFSPLFRGPLQRALPEGNRDMLH